MQVEGSPADQAYRRAVILSDTWRRCREDVEEQFKSRLKEGLEGVEAMLEAEFLVSRDQSIEALIRAIWEETSFQPHPLHAIRCCEGLEELRYALSRNLEQNLALERCCLRMSNQIPAS
ncbi:MAG: hypothetical protein HC904_12570 [Blastochloris sp.]|nr:hypothetical protein [Blastochloris sp.]